MNEAAKTATVERPKVDEVLVRCAGIVSPIGYNLTPDGYQPIYLEFVPGQPTKTLRPYAAFLVSQDPTRFIIEEVQQQAAAEAPATAKVGGRVGRPKKAQ